jgi:hypothetical protein
MEVAAFAAAGFQYPIVWQAEGRDALRAAIERADFREH